MINLQANKAVEDGLANPLRYFASHLTAPVSCRMPGSARGRTKNRRACRHQAGHRRQTVPVCFESSWRNRWSVLRWSSGHGGGVWQWHQTISSAALYDRTRGSAATVRHNSLSNKEKQIWVIKGKKTKAKGNNRKRPSLIQRKNENWKKKRRNKCPDRNRFTLK